MTRPRVVMVAPSAARRGGGDIWLAQLLENLTPQQIDMLVVFETVGELADLASTAGHHVATLGRRGKPCDADLAGLTEPLTHILAGEKPQVTVHWSPRAHIYGSRARQLLARNSPVAWVQHVIPSDFWLHKLASAYRANVVACVSSAVAEAQLGWYPDQPVTVLYPGTGGPPALPDEAEVRISKKASHGSLLLGVLGRVEPWKGQDVAVRAVHHLREQGLPARALLIGETRSPAWPSYASEVETLVAELGVGRHISFTGHLVRPAAALTSLDVLVCSSRQEGFSLAVAEGMGAAIPVVATRCGGPEDLIDDGANGLLIPIDDPVALAGAVARLATDSDLAVRLAAAGYATWVNQFTAQHSAGRFLDFVQRLAAS